MQQYDGAPAAVEEPRPPVVPPGRGPRRLRGALALLLAAALGLGLALSLQRGVLPVEPRPDATGPTGSAAPRSADPEPTSAAGQSPRPSPSAAPDPAAGRDAGVEAALTTRAEAVMARDRDLFLSTVDPAAADFGATQAELYDRVAALELDDWAYQVTGAGPDLSPERAAELPAGAAILQVRLTYRLTGTDTTTDREQYLTVVPRAGRWLLAADTDASAAGLDTQRDLWDLGPVHALRGDSSLVLADSRGADRAEMRTLADEADLAVSDVGEVWSGPWSKRPVVLLPRNQDDMATLIGGDGEGLAQIAAVTTGSFADGLGRGDRVVINPGAWETLGALGRRVVLTHEMTHVATRATGVQAVPIWLSEGFADYVAYRANPVPLQIVAGDVLDDVRAGKGPRRLPDDLGFDASRGDIAASYEGAWLACRMISERYGEQKLVGLYSALADSAGSGWPDETVEVLGIGERELVRDWRAYLRAKARE